MKAKEVLKMLRINRSTLSHYVKEGRIEVNVLPSGRYDYVDDSVLKFVGVEENRKNLIYARVSTKAQKKSLEHQIEIIKEYANCKGNKVDGVYADIASGLSYDRGEFNNLLREVMSYKVKNVFISDKDRLTRVSFDMWKEMFNKFYCDIIVLNDDGKGDDGDKEIFEDIISLLHCFSMRMYSRRRKRKLELMKEDLNVSNAEI